MKATRILLRAAATAARGASKGKPPFTDLKVAISIYSKDEGEKEAFKSVVEKVTRLGADYSPIVHKRVHFLIASQDAVHQRTQRIRKALKFSVPILSLEFVDACEQASKFLPHQEYLVDVPPPTAAPEKTPIDNRRDEEPNNNNKRHRTVDLGCCCSCHDAGKAHCEWCVQYHLQDGDDDEENATGDSAGCNESETAKSATTTTSSAAAAPHAKRKKKSRVL